MNIETIDFNKIDYFKKNPFFLDCISGINNNLYNIDFSLNTLSNISNNKKIDIKLLDEIYTYNSNFLYDESTNKSIEKLKDRNTQVIITGQQPHLYASPMFTIYKIINAIKLSEIVEKKTKKPVVPIFWNASDDHDLYEVNKIIILDAEKKLYEDRLKLNFDSSPIYSYRTKEEYEKLNLIIFEKIQKTEFSSSLIEMFSRHIDSISNQFTYSLKKIFYNKGLIVIEPKILRYFARDIYKKIIENDELINNFINSSGNFIQRDSSSNLFYINKKRKKIYIENENYIFDNKIFSKKDFAQYVFENSINFSPNVSARPIVQDYIFPVLAYIGGPGECSYFSQLKNIYKHLNIFMPAIFPRISLTIISEKEKRLINKYFTNILDIFNDKPARTDNSKIENYQKELEKHILNINNQITKLKDFSLSLNNSVFESLSSSFKKINLELVRIEEKFIKECEKLEGISRAKIEKLKNIIIPKNKLQERVFSPLYFLNFYGFDFIDRLIENIDIFNFSHQIIYID